MVTFEDFKPIRNKIRGFDADKLLELEVRMMYEMQDMAVEKVRHCPPWYLMLLIKWTLMYGELNSTKKSPKQNDLVALINMVHQLGDRLRPPSDYSNVYLFLKCMAFQQFWYRRGLAGSDFGRQLKLFLELMPQGLLEEMFRTKIGISPKDFFELAFVLASRFMQPTHAMFFDMGYFDTLKKLYPEDVIRCFLTRLSCDFESVKAFLKTEDARVKDVDAKLYEQTPLRRRPLLRLGEKYLCYSPNVLWGGLSTLAYDVLKEQLPEQFTRIFSEAFEKYVKLGLVYSGLAFWDESKLQRTYPSKKMVDFIVPLPNANVFVESKAIEMTPLAQVSPDVRVVSNYLRVSVIKAIKQALVAIKCVDAQPLESLRGGSVKDSFLLVVTFKDLFLGSGADFVAGEVREEIEDFAKQEGLDSQRLPSENIFFLSAREFEFFMEVCKKGLGELSDIIRGMIVANRNVLTKKFLVEQHVERFEGIQGPAYAVEPFERMHRDLMTRLRNA